MKQQLTDADVAISLQSGHWVMWYLPSLLSGLTETALGAITLPGALAMWQYCH